MRKTQHAPATNRPQKGYHELFVSAATTGHLPVVASNVEDRGDEVFLKEWNEACRTRSDPNYMQHNLSILSLLSPSFSTLSPSSHTLPYYFTRARSKARALSDGASERMPPRARGMRRLSLSLLGLWVATHNLVML